MEESKKRGPGRPTDKRKDAILQLRIDSDTHGKLSEYAKKNKLSMSQIIREAVCKLIEENECDEKV